MTMKREEITNSQDYKATEAAIEWWYSLPEEQRKATDINAEPDIVDAYSDGIIYGWNNPSWISVKESLPKVSGDYIICEKRGFVREAHYFELDDLWMFHGGALVSPTHWMPLPQPPRKED